MNGSVCVFYQGLELQPGERIFTARKPDADIGAYDVDSQFFISFRHFLTSFRAQCSTGGGMRQDHEDKEESNEDQT